jgi:hypothetical protein
MKIKFSTNYNLKFGWKKMDWKKTNCFNVLSFLNDYKDVFKFQVFIRFYAFLLGKQNQDTSCGSLNMKCIDLWLGQ